MKKPEAADMIEVLACDIEARPKGAPSIFDLAPHIEKVARLPESISVFFASAAAADVAAFVEAERLCCAGIGWRLQVEPAVLLTIGATPRSSTRSSRCSTTREPRADRVRGGRRRIDAALLCA